MLSDFQTNKTFRGPYDFCVIGSGPAGMTVALRLALAGRRVIMIESGAAEYSDRSQSLYRGLSTGRNAYIETTRLRMLGGTSNHWSGRCRPFDASDFSASPPGDLPGWPIAYADIEPYLPEAMRILDLPAKDFPAHNPPLPGNDFSADRYLLSPPTRFAQKYAQALRETPGLDVFLNCNCVDFNFDPKAQRVFSLTVADYAGQRKELVAKHFVLATGAIENSRLLLNSAALAKHGVVKPDGMVGRCFMEHLNVDLGTFVLRDDKGTDGLQYFTTDEFVKKHKVGKGNVSFGLVKEVKSYGRTAEIKSFFKNLACAMGVADKVQFISNFRCPGDGSIGTLIEQHPDRRSRITLAEEKDALGLRKAVFHWDINETDLKTMRTIALEVAKRFADSGLGYVKLNEKLFGDADKFDVQPHAHHMGTTRMAKSAETGVVDADCRMFGTENLFIAGSSIFATGGASNPTMPIVQFALRLVDHLGKLG